MSGGGLETGFLHKISVKMPKLSQKPGFLDYGRGTGILPVADIDARSQ